MQEQMCTNTHTEHNHISLIPFREADIFQMASGEVFYLMNLLNWKNEIL